MPSPHPSSPAVRVVFVSSGFVSDEPGPANGPYIYARYLWDAFLDDAEVEFHLVVPSAGSMKHPRLHVTGVAAGRIDFHDALARKALDVADNLVENVIVHTNNSNTCALLLKCPHVLWGQVNDYMNADLWVSAVQTLREQGIRRFVALFRRRWLEKRFIERQEKTLCNSNYTRERLIAAYRPSCPERMLTVYKSVDVSFFEPSVGGISSDSTGRSGGLQFAFVGSNPVVKGLDLLVGAFLSAAIPDATLDVAGIDEVGFRKIWPGLAARAAAAGNIHFLGRLSREQVRDLLWRSQGFVLPSRNEALGVAILEALAAGCYVVGSTAGGIPEILSGCACGCLFEAGNESALIRTLKDFAEKRPDKDPAFAISRAEVLARFSHERMVREVRNLYLNQFVSSFGESAGKEFDCCCE